MWLPTRDATGDRTVNYDPGAADHDHARGRLAVTESAGDE